MQSGTLTSAGLQYSRSLAEYLSTEQKIDLEGCGKEMLVLTGKYHASCKLFFDGALVVLKNSGNFIAYLVNCLLRS